MNAQKIVGIGLGLYFGTFVMAALLGLPRMHTYLAASALGAATVGYALFSNGWQVIRDQFVRWQILVATFLGIVCISFLVNRAEYDFSLTLKVVGYASLFVISTLVALTTGSQSARACMHTYLACLVFAMVVTLAVNNTNSHNHRLYGPTFKQGVKGSGLHHNEVGLLGMTAVMLATVSGWRAVILITPPSLYTAYLAGSRGSLLGILIALTVFAVVREFVSRSARRGFRRVPTRGITLLAASLCIALVVAVFAGSFVIDDIFHLHDSRRGLSSGFTGRWEVWQGILNHWKDSPIIGCGYGIVRGEALAEGETADGGFLMLTAELGLAGLLLFLFLIYNTFKTSWANVATTGDARSMTALVFLVTFCFINIFESRFVGTGSIGLGMFLYLSSLAVLRGQEHLSEARVFAAPRLLPE